MQNNLLFSLILNISLLVLMATVLTELRPLRLMIKRQERSVYNQLFLGLIFGLLSIIRHLPAGFPSHQQHPQGCNPRQ